MANLRQAEENYRKKHYAIGDVLTIADAYLAEHLPDDNLLINTDRLRDIGFRHKGPQYSAYEYMIDGVVTIDYLVRFDCIKIGDHSLPHIKTIGQVRLLIRALGGKA